MSRRFNPPALVARVLLGSMAIVGGGSAVTAVLGALRRSTLSREMTLAGRRSYGGDAVATAHGAWVTWHDGDSVGLDHPSVGVGLVHALPTVLAGVAGLVAALMLLIVVTDVQRGVPFDDRAARRLRIAAITVATAALAYPVLSTWADAAVFHAAVVGEDRVPSIAGGISSGLNRIAPWLLVAALLAAFSQAFREGRRLADETAGLV